MADNEQRLMSPIVVDTKNAYQDLEVIADAAKVDPKYLDFNILSISTKYKIKSDGDFTELSDSERNIFNDDEFISNPDLAISQSYRVEYFDKRGKKEPLLPKISLGVNKNMTKIVATIKEDINVKYEPNFEKELIGSIRKKLLKSEILIGIRDTTLVKEINKITSMLRIKGIIDKSMTFVVTSWLDPVLSVDDQINYYYKTKSNKAEESDRVNYSDRGFLQSVVEGEVIIEYIKAKDGQAGRNVKGQLIPVSSAKKANQVEIKVTDNIEVKEDENSVKYISKKNGYVSQDNGTYDVKEELDVNEVSFKTTGSIETSLDSDVKINIKESDILKDAVGAGMSIETNTINVEGNVARGASIKARNVTIGGQTHAKSVIEAQNANIAVHLGRLVCEEAVVDRLENGHIEAKKVTVNSVIGGEIIAAEVRIGTLFSNASITAASLVEIENLKGTNNRIMIDAGRIMDYEDKITQASQKMAKLKAEIISMPKELEKKKNIIDSNKSSVTLIKQRIEELRNGGKTPPQSFIAKLKDFQSLVYEYNLLVKNYGAKKLLLDDLKDDIKKMQSMVFEAKIINKNRWKELNEIKFRLIEPKKDITYVTRENELARLIMLKHLVIDEEDVYEIKRSNEID
ncbi:putative protein (DUF342 domain) [Campylobacter iguaniorum]|uniref:flagellar assembly protein A n=1 Tax=Campylobacter iguaniorum TaxID=1244531 RepID=UPI00073A1C94|nr:flagellar assembly protein A [Campylobacter iguaniorum]ALV24733.1 putative protein (DUF342 domain) [Campylobacter iguaniorum]